MRIRMLKEVTAAADPAGTARRRYAEGEVLMPEAEWQAWMFKAFLAEGWAELVPEAKDGAG